jgi:hypothetical protein
LTPLDSPSPCSALRVQTPPDLCLGSGLLLGRARAGVPLSSNEYGSLCLSIPLPVDQRDRNEPDVPSLAIPIQLRACLKIAGRSAAKDFGGGQGGEVGASPQRAVTTEPTPVAAKRPAARRVCFAVWFSAGPLAGGWQLLPCCLHVASTPNSFHKTGWRGIFSQALRKGVGRASFVPSSMLSRKATGPRRGHGGLRSWADATRP